MIPQNPTIHATDAAHILAVASAAQAACAAALAEYTNAADDLVADSSADDDHAWPDWWHQGWHVIDLCQQAAELAARRGRCLAPADAALAAPPTGTC